MESPPEGQTGFHGFSSLKKRGVHMRFSKPFIFIKETLIHVVALGLFLASGMMGLFAATGICIFLWGSDVTTTALNDPPQRTHPLFWVWMALMIPGMITGFIGGLFTFVFPLYALFEVKLFNTGPNDQRLINAYIRLLEKILAINLKKKADEGK